MYSVSPDEVAFDASASLYRDHPLTAGIGQTARPYVVDPGPNLPSTFHVIGGRLASTYADGETYHEQSSGSTYTIAPGL